MSSDYFVVITSELGSAAGPSWWEASDMEAGGRNQYIQELPFSHGIEGVFEMEEGLMAQGTLGM